MKHLLTAATLALASTAAGCHPTSDEDYHDSLLTISSLHVRRVSTLSPSVVLVTLMLKNETPASTVNNLTYATFFVGGTTTRFDIEGLYAGTLCRDEDRPWDVPPGETREIRMRLDLTTTGAILHVPCQHEFEGEVGFDASRAIEHTATREGPEEPDFSGSWGLEFLATMDPNAKAKAYASADVEPPR